MAGQNFGTPHRFRDAWAALGTAGTEEGDRLAVSF
jgi:hypothetical protein